jgi:protein tyrosine/serine phosphatase
MISEVVPGVYRGPRPKSVQEIRDLGIHRVLCLESGVRDGFFEDPYETQLAEAFDINEKRVDMSGIWAPERHDVEQAFVIICDAISAQEKIYVHCMAGVDRTGFVIAVFRMRCCGWTYAQAKDEYIKMGLHWRFRWWLHELKKYEASR